MTVGLATLFVFALAACQREPVTIEEAPGVTLTPAPVDHHDHEHPHDDDHALLDHSEDAAFVAVACPMMGTPTKADVYAVHDGKKYHFCCAGCIPTFEEDPEAMIAEHPEWAETATPVDETS